MLVPPIARAADRCCDEHEVSVQNSNQRAEPAGSAVKNEQTARSASPMKALEVYPEALVAVPQAVHDGESSIQARRSVRYG
jgi:hypothetical protein